MAYIVRAHIVTAHIVMAHIVMADILMASRSQCDWLAVALPKTMWGHAGRRLLAATMPAHSDAGPYGPLVLKKPIN